MFSCETCAAAPHLQDIQGCFEPAKRGAFAIYAVHEFDRCPVLYQSKRTREIVRAGLEHSLKSMSFVQREALPAKRLAALSYVESFLLKLKESQRAS